MTKLERQFIGSIGMQPIKDIVNNLENIGMGFKVRKSPLSDMPNYSYKLFAEYNSENKEVKNLIIEIDDDSCRYMSKEKLDSLKSDSLEELKTNVCKRK